MWSPNCSILYFKCLSVFNALETSLPTKSVNFFLGCDKTLSKFSSSVTYAFSGWAFTLLCLPFYFCNSCFSFLSSSVSGPNFWVNFALNVSMKSFPSTNGSRSLKPVNNQFRWKFIKSNQFSFLDLVFHKCNSSVHLNKQI